MNGSPVADIEVGLQNFYSDLINCKIVLEVVGAYNLLNAPSTAERIFLRFLNVLEEVFVKLAVEPAFDLDALSFYLFIKYCMWRIEINQRALDLYNYCNVQS